MLVWTHRYDFLFKVLAVTAVVALGLALLPSSPPGGPSRVGEPAVFATFLVVYAAGWALIWRPFLRPAADWAYASRTFGIRPSWQDARKLDVLFALGLGSGRWHPCKDVAFLPVEERLETLLARAAAVRESRSVGYFQLARERTPLGRMLHVDTFVVWQVGIFVGVALIGLAATAQVGPAMFFVQWMSRDDGSYSVNFTIVLGLLAWALVTWPLCYAFDRTIRTKDRAL